MENYKVDVVEDFTLHSKGVKETELPQILVDAVREGLSKLTQFADGSPLPEDPKLIITPIMVNPNLKEVTFGVLQSTIKGTEFKYSVTIQTKDYRDDIYNRLKSLKDEKSGID